MEQSPDKHRLEQVLRSDKLVAGGFMGTDLRSVDEIIDADIAEIAKAGVTVRQLAERMRQITKAARTGLGTWVRIDDNRRAMVAESKGTLVCPWPHSGRYYKTVTTVEHVESAQTIKWADLNIHMIAEHGFFEGRGAVFRIEPGCLIEIIL